MVFEIFVESLFTGRIVFMILLGLGVGYFIGFAQPGPLGLIVSIVIMLVFQMGLFVTGDYIRALTYIGNTGSAGFKVGDVFLIHFILHPCILLAGIVIGWKTRGIEIEQIGSAIDAMTAKEIVDDLNLYAAHPDLATAGWFPNRWEKMSDDDRVYWTEQHIERLKGLYCEADGEGLVFFGKTLPSRLAQIDKGA